MLDIEKVLEALVRRYRELGSAIAELAGEQAEIKEQVKNIVDVGWKAQIDGVAVHLRAPNRSFDLATAIGLLDEETKKSCVVTRYDPALVRAAVETAGLIEDAMLEKEDAVPVLKL